MYIEQQYYLWLFLFLEEVPIISGHTHAVNAYLGVLSSLSNSFSIFLGFK